MRLPAKKILWVVLPIVVLLMSRHVLAHEQPQSDQTSGDKPELPVTVPELGNSMPLATELSGRLVD